MFHFISVVNLDYLVYLIDIDSRFPFFGFLIQYVPSLVTTKSGNRICRGFSVIWISSFWRRIFGLLLSLSPGSALPWRLGAVTWRLIPFFGMQRDFSTRSWSKTGLRVRGKIATAASVAARRMQILILRGFGQYSLGQGSGRKM